jgi:hypothetical protein
MLDSQSPMTARVRLWQSHDCERERTGILVDLPNDVQSWATVITELMNDPRTRDRIATAAQREVLPRYRAPELPAKWESLVGQMIASF